MRAGHRNCRPSRIHPDHIMSTFRQRLRRQSRATADIEPTCRMPNLTVDPLHPQRIHPVQWPHWPIRVPPFGGQGVETRDFLRRDARSRHSLHVAHSYSCQYVCRPTISCNFNLG